MSDNIKKSLELIDQFFNQYSDEYINQVLQEIDKMDFAGETVNSYVQSFHTHYVNVPALDFPTHAPSTEAHWNTFPSWEYHQTFEVHKVEPQNFSANIPSDFHKGNDFYKGAA